MGLLFDILIVITVLYYYKLYAAADVDHIMTMATYYNMAPVSSNCSLCPAPIKSWTNRTYSGECRCNANASSSQSSSEFVYA